MEPGVVYKNVDVARKLHSLGPEPVGTAVLPKILLHERQPLRIRGQKHVGIRGIASIMAEDVAPSA